MKFPFHIPNIVGREYRPGPQPYSPGESHIPWAGHMGMQFSAMPWPGAVPVLNVLSSFGGVARMRAPLPMVNQYAVLPTDYLFLGDTAGKSQG